MISDNVLADRLNAFRNGEDLPEVESEEVLNQFSTISNNISLLGNISHEIFNLSFMFLQSITYGFALKTIFATDWKFIAFLAIGFSVQMITSQIFNIFKK